MQTFLPYAGFDRSSEVLDSPRLGKQRVETLQVLRALELPEYGWSNHPVVRMWRGRTPALVLYGLANVRAWRARGHADSTDALIAEFAPEVAGLSQDDLDRAGLLPHWLGEEALHVSHRAALLRKDPAFYGPVLAADQPDGVPEDLPYHWPDPDPGAPAASPVQRRLWVVRPPTPGWRELFLAAGFVALGSQAGLGQDVGDLDRTGLREALVAANEAAAAGGGPRRRPGKDLRQLEAFLHEMAPGDPVAVLVDGGRSLVVGEVTGGYRHAPGRGTADGDPWLPHLRTVRWHETLPRSAVHPPATLQDPRSLFRVQLAADAGATGHPGTGVVDLRDLGAGTAAEPAARDPGADPVNAVRTGPVRTAG